MTPPAFWQQDGLWPRLLSPISALVSQATARRVARPGWCAPVPVLCCGNAGVGGAGKTTVALDLGMRLQARQVAVHFLSRGYRGQVRGVVRVEPGRDGAALVGDEPLLLAGVAPTWVGADRAASARAAIASGASALIMDDGLQNPGLCKTMSLLVMDGAAGFGNGRVLPAGPLREPVREAASRCRAAVLIGADRRGASLHLSGLPILAATLAPERSLAGQRVFGFCGIARPGKFRDTLRDAGAEILGWAEFPDHHPFSAGDIERVMTLARTVGGRPITTLKDAVRLPQSVRDEVDTLGVRLAWRDERQVDALLDEFLG